MKYLINYWNRYLTIRRRMDKETSWKSLGIATLVSVLLNALWAAPLIIMIASMMIFIHLQIFATILIFIVSTIAIYGFSFVHFYVLKKIEPTIKDLNTNIAAITESTIVAIILVTIGIIFVVQLYGRI